METAKKTTLDLFKELPLSQGLIDTLNNIQKLKDEKDAEKATKITVDSIAKVRLSEIILLCELARQQTKENDLNCLNYALLLFRIAIEHSHKDNPVEKQAVDVIKTEMAKVQKQIENLTSL